MLVFPCNNLMNMYKIKVGEGKKELPTLRSVESSIKKYRSEWEHIEKNK